jgi:hypothetical protein
MRRKRCVPAAAAPAFMAAVSINDCSSAASASPAGGSVHLVGYSDNDRVKSTVILTGPIGDYGEAVSVNPDVSTNPEHNSELNLVLTRGVFRVGIAALDKKLVAAVSHLLANLGTVCSASPHLRPPAVTLPGPRTIRLARSTLTDYAIGSHDTRDLARPLALLGLA